MEKNQTEWTPRRLLRSLTSSRLRADLEEFDVKLDKLKRELTRAGASNSHGTWIEACGTHRQHALAALDEGDIERGYQRLQSAEREVLPGLSEKERAAFVISLRQEVKKKLGEHSWRGEAVTALLDPQGDVPVESIQGAVLHLNIASQNTYRKIALVKRQLLAVGLVIFCLLAIALVAGLRGWLSLLDTASDQQTGPLLICAIYAGLLGGALSAALSVSQPDPKAKIPEAQLTRWLALTRCCVGAGAAIPVFLLIRGEVVKLGTGAPNTFALLFFCFLAGFSERWFLGTLDSISKDQTRPPPKDPVPKGEKAPAGGKTPAAGKPPDAGNERKDKQPDKEESSSDPAATATQPAHGR